MTGKLAAVLLLMVAVTLWAGCVERKMLIRSEPPGAPVWVDEQYAGETPLEYDFSHYGARGIRVGPIRDAEDKVEYVEQVRVVEIEPPWYQTFPIDFFFEVLYPGRLTDAHEVPVLVLERAEVLPESRRQERVQELRERAEKFRQEALYSIPEAEEEK